MIWFNERLKNTENYSWERHVSFFFPQTDEKERTLKNIQDSRFSNGLLADRMPVEVVEKVINTLSFADMAAYGATTKSNFAIMQCAVLQRVRKILEDFGIPFTTFMDMMDVHQAVISGSMALYMFDPSQDWRPNDMDLYIPRYRLRRVLFRLRVMGFVPVWGTTVRHQYRRVNAIASVTKLTNGDRTIDVIESWFTSPFAPIFKFHLTAVMNFVSSEGFFSSYPKLTNERRALKNPISFINSVPSSRTIECYEKYEAWGYELALNSKEWEGEEEESHHCRLSWRCPHTIRHMFDGGCLFIDFSDERVPWDIESAVAQRCFDDRRAIIWHLGGRVCEHTYEPLASFSSTLRGHSFF